MECDIFHFSALTLLVGWQEWHPACKKLDVGLLVVMIWLEFCTTYSSSSPVVTNTSIILCFNKHRLTQVHVENDRYNGERERSPKSVLCIVIQHMRYKYKTKNDNNVTTMVLVKWDSKNISDVTAVKGSKCNHVKQILWSFWRNSQCWLLVVGYFHINLLFSVAV